MQREKREGERRLHQGREAILVITLCCKRRPHWQLTSHPAPQTTNSLGLEQTFNRIGHIRILGIGLELACNGGLCGLIFSHANRTKLFLMIFPRIRPPLQARSSPIPRIRIWPITHNSHQQFRSTYWSYSIFTHALPPRLILKLKLTNLNRICWLKTVNPVHAKNGVRTTGKIQRMSLEGAWPKDYARRDFSSRILLRKVTLM